MMSAIMGSGAPVGSATASAGGSRIMNARLRSATASASLTTPGSEMPGVSSRLKIAILSSAKSGRNAAVKSPGKNVVNGLVGKPPSSGVAPIADPQAVNDPVRATLTSADTGVVAVPIRLSGLLAGSLLLSETLRNTSEAPL